MINRVFIKNNKGKKLAAVIESPDFEEIDHFYKRDPEKLELVNKKIVDFLLKYM